MSEENVVSNPYIISGPVQDARLFFGREEVFGWVLDTMNAFPPRQMMALFGPSQIGKSSLLRQMTAGKLGTAVLPVYVRLTQLGTESLSIFYQNLAEVTMAALARNQFEFGDLDSAAYVNDPQLAFNQQVISPVLVGLNGRKVLYLIDDVDQFMVDMENGYLPAETLADLAKLLSKYPQLYTIFAVDRSPEAELTGQLLFLNEAFHNYLEPLDQETAVALIREPVRYTIVRDVANYIHELSAGRPGAIQQICHALFERQRKYGLKQITIADVAAEYRYLVVQGQWEVSEESQLPEFYLKGGGGERGAARRSLFRSWRPDTRTVGLVILMLAVVSAVFGWRSRGVTLLGAQEETATPAARPLVIAAGTDSLSVADASPAPTNTPVPTSKPATETAVHTATATAAPSNTPTLPATLSPTLAPTETPVAAAPLLVREIDGMAMVLIPGDTFMMGASAGDTMAGEDERPRHRVELSDYYIDQYEVSVGQYAVFLTELGVYERACVRVDCALPRGRIGYTSYLVEQVQDDTVIFEPLPGFENYPMNHVSWYGAQSYCEYVGGRLPTEAEWEYAARGDDGRIYPWGDEPPARNLAVYQSQSFSDLLPVDALPDGVSPFGVYGMAGSLWEWTGDWYTVDYYAESPVVNPTGPESGLGRVQRGGAWPNNNEADRIRTTNRTYSDPHFISSTIGFRCVLPALEVSQ